MPWVHPDECDIDTNDPDGNELASAHVNVNSIPDECEPDCNHNSVRDAWDTSQSTSYGVNANGIPDECEGGQIAAPNGGEGCTPSPTSLEDGDDAAPNMNMGIQAPDQDAAWLEFYEWSFAQCWGPNCEATPSEQFQSYVNKLTELGLPIMGPTMTP